MVKIKKTCNNCVWFIRKECKTPGKICHKWIFLKANCALCTYRKECKKLGKKVSKNNICLTFKKEKRRGKRKKLKISHKEMLRINKKLEKDSKEVEDTFSPADIVENIISTDYAPEVFDLVDDRDILKSYNPIQFIIGKEFMEVKVFPMQLKTFLEFLGAYCPDCSDTNFIRNKIEVDTPVDEILDRTVLYRDGVCRKCGLTKYEAVKTGKQRFFNQLIGVAGQRSSKSTSVAILSAAITHEYLKLPSPVEFFHLLSTSTLHGTFVGLRYSDAYDNLWEPYSKLLTKTKWFKEYHAFLEETGNRLGVELFKFRDTFVTYSHKNIGVYPAGPDKRKLRGRCLPGYQLINNSKGLIRAADGEKLLGTITYKGRNKRKIVGQVTQEEKKEVIRITLTNGIELDASFDHRVLTLIKKGKAVWKHQAELLGEYVFCQLGGDFPGELVFDSTVEIHTPTYVKIARYISKGRVFTIDKLADKFSLHKNGILSYHIGPMIKAGVLERKSCRDNLGHPLPSRYRVNSKFDLKRWEQLREGKINNNRKKITIPTKMTPKLARLIGYLIADGWVKGNRVEFWTTSKDKSRDFNNLFKTIFGCKVYKNKDSDAKYGPLKNKPAVISSFSCKSIRQFLTYLGMTGVDAYTKTVPWCILEAPRNCAVECVSAMISCDGGIVNRSDKIGVYYATSSYELAKTLQLLMMKLGYACNRKKKGGGNHVWLTRNDSVNFIKHDYTGLDKRSWKKDSKIKKAKGIKSYYKYRIPFSDVFTTSSLNRKFRKKPKGRFKRYCDNSLLFSKVVKTESLGEMVVHDIGVDVEDAIFPANNVLVHNTRFIAAIDELGWFIGGGRETIKFNPDEIYTALDNSLVPILPASKKLFKQHPDVPTAYGMYISSPSSKTDKAMRLYKQSKGSKTIYGFHKPTWEFNPDITKDSLAEKFRENPTTAERDWGANPPFSSDPFIKGPSNLVPIFTKRRNLFKVDGYVTTSDSLGGNLIYPKISFVRKHTFPSVLAIDCGYKINSFACTLNHWFVKNNELYYAISGAIEIIPDPYPISFPDVYDYVITPIVKEFNVKAVVFDRWQSIDLSQRTYKDHKIDSFLYSVTMDDFGNYRNKIYSGDCIFPRLECELDDLLSLKKELGSLIAGNPISHLFLQLLMCKDTGRTVTKGDDITDDLLRSAVLGYSILTHKEYSELFTTEGRVLNKYNRIESVLSLNLRSQPAPTEIESIGWGVKNVPGIGVSASRDFLRPQMRPLVTPATQHFGRR